MPTQKSDSPATLTLETGQVWEMADSNLRIGLIGKTLVHYKHYRGSCPRASVSLTGKAALQEFLVKHKAVLAKGKPASAKAASRRRSSRVSA
jgi:hypothetical protein